MEFILKNNIKLECNNSAQRKRINSSSTCKGLAMLTLSALCEFTISLMQTLRVLEYIWNFHRIIPNVGKCRVRKSQIIPQLLKPLATRWMDSQVESERWAMEIILPSNYILELKNPWVWYEPSNIFSCQIVLENFNTSAACYIGLLVILIQCRESYNYITYFPENTRIKQLISHLLNVKSDLNLLSSSIITIFWLVQSPILGTQIAPLTW